MTEHHGSGSRIAMGPAAALEGVRIGDVEILCPCAEALSGAGKRRHTSYHAALAILRDHLTDVTVAHALRRLLTARALVADVSLLDDYQVLDISARLIAQGILSLAPAGDGRRVVGSLARGDAGAREEPAAPASSGAETVEERPEAPDRRAWIGIELLAEDGTPASWERFRVRLPDGGLRTGELDRSGRVEITGIPPGTCKVTFPGLDSGIWYRAGTSPSAEDGRSGPPWPRRPSTEEVGEETKTAPSERPTSAGERSAEPRSPVAEEHSLVLLAYNIFMLSPPLHAPKPLMRADLLVEYLDDCYDAIIFCEAFYNEARERLLDGLAKTYPYQSSVVDQDKDIEDGGVVVVSKWPMVDRGHHVFDVSALPDGLSAKGVKYVTIHKDGRRFHLFGSHTQAGAGNHAIRRSQFQQIQQYIQRQIIPRSEPIIIGGDLNVDKARPPCGDLDLDNEFEEMLEVLHAEFPRTRCCPPYTYDGLANDFIDGREQEYLDYLLPCTDGLMPHRVGLSVVVHRTPKPWRRRSRRDERFRRRAHRDISDHYAVKGKFTYTFKE